MIVDTSALLAYFDAGEARHADCAAAIVERYHDQDIGVADASIVLLAERYRTRTIATLDRMHFEVLGPTTGGRLRIVP